MPDPLPPDARCKRCGYRLRALTTGICPECGTGFDPSDPTTFDPYPQRTRWRRWMGMGAMGLAVAALLFTLTPRRILTAQVSFRCKVCGRTEKLTRRELAPATWVPLRYPGWHRSEILLLEEGGPVTTQPCCAGPLAMNLQSDLWIGGWVSGSGTSDGSCYVNGILIKPENARSILHAFLARDNQGVAFSQSPEPPDWEELEESAAEP